VLQGMAGFMKRSAHIQRVALFHYTTKSREDFAHKVARGANGPRVKDWTFFASMQKCAPFLYLLLAASITHVRMLLQESATTVILLNLCMCDVVLCVTCQCPSLKVILEKE
jgi:hypothetical protein